LQTKKEIAIHLVTELQRFVGLKAIALSGSVPLCLWRTSNHFGNLSATVRAKIVDPKYQTERFERGFIMADSGAALDRHYKL